MQPESSLSTAYSVPGSPGRPYAPPAGHRRYRLEVQWDGQGFVGWQSQPGRRSVQDTLQGALNGLAEGRRPVAAGRTDSGVHALSMTLHWDLAEPVRLSPPRLLRALNGRLPPDLAVLALAPAEPGFHARSSCLGRRYLYRVLNTPQRRPLWRGRALHVAQPLRLEAMREAAAALVGVHDFAAFATREERQTRRELYRLELERSGELLELHLHGESFLRQMVRCLVGTLLQVGRGELDRAGVEAVLASGERGRAGVNVRAEGLYFAKAIYAGER